MKNEEQVSMSFRATNERIEHLRIKLNNMAEKGLSNKDVRQLSQQLDTEFAKLLMEQVSCEPFQKSSRRQTTQAQNPI